MVSILPAERGRKVTLRCSRARGSNVLALIGATCNRNVKPLDLLAPSGKTHFEFQAIVIVEILIGTIKRDESSKFGRQTLLDIGWFERRTATVLGLGGTASRIAGNGPVVQSARMLV